MVKVKAVNMFPSQIESVLKGIEGVSSEYIMRIANTDGRDRIYLRFEAEQGASYESLERKVVQRFKSMIGVTVIPKAEPIGNLPRSVKKTVRIIDERND